MSKQIVVWLDHQEARVVHVEPEGIDETKIHAPARHIHRHAKGASEPTQHTADMQHYFRELAEALQAADQVLVVGPGTAKLQFLHYAHEHGRELARRIIGMETVDHPSDRQLVAYAKKYFLEK